MQCVYWPFEKIPAGYSAELDSQQKSVSSHENSSAVLLKVKYCMQYPFTFPAVSRQSPFPPQLFASL